jgi:hypothetical protein
MGPLSDLRVIELAGIGPGPFCGMILSDLGADVLRIQNPARGARSPELEQSEHPISVVLKTGLVLPIPSYAPMALSSDAKTIDVVSTVFGLIVLILRIAAYLSSRFGQLEQGAGDCPVRC